jgi:serine/threonine protein kinase/Tfp pilus assembly protein PilF
MVGSTISHYRVINTLGGGGMGVVYEAEDIRLGRRVALKFVSEALSKNPQAVQRFQAEARAASALNHPNICTIYEIDQVEGLHFIAMELLEGQTFDQLIAERPVAIATVIDLAIQVTDAFEAAHARGIVHRDVKPANLFCTTRGQAKVLDFGLAKLTSDARSDTIAPTEPRTIPGSVAGTVEYMSPEQAQGETLDARSDLFSLGAVLYQMATGRSPFAGKTVAAVFDAIINRAPLAPGRLNPEVPAELERIIHKALDKDRAVRYQSAMELKADLRRLTRDLESGVRTPRGSDRGRVRARKAPPDSIAIIPFTADEDGLRPYAVECTESLINALSASTRLRVVPRSTVFRYEGRDMEPTAIGRELQVGAVLTGHVGRRLGVFVVSVELVDVHRQSQLWGDQLTRAIETPTIESVRDLAREITDTVKRRMDAPPPAASVPTEDGEVYQLYLKGRYHLNRRTEENIRRAFGYYKLAADRDPTFAPAHAGMADANLLLAIYGCEAPHDAVPMAHAHAAHALELNPSLAEAYVTRAMLLFCYDWNWAAAEKAFKRGIDLNPAYPPAHYWYGYSLIALGRLQEGEAQMRKGQQLEPLSMIAATFAGFPLYFSRRLDEAIRHFQHAIEMDPNFAVSHVFLGEALYAAGRIREAVEAAERAQAISDAPLILGPLGCFYGAAGARQQAEQILERLQARPHVAAHAVAAVHLGMGNVDAAIDWFDSAIEQHSMWVIWLKMEPMYDTLRASPRFSSLLAKVGLPA